MDFNDPTQRAALIERVGVDEYNRQVAEWRRRSIVETCNGHAIRQIQSARFGTIYTVGVTGRGHATLDGAREIAKSIGAK